MSTSNPSLQKPRFLNQSSNPTHSILSSKKQWIIRLMGNIVGFSGRKDTHNVYLAKDRNPQQQQLDDSSPYYNVSLGVPGVSFRAASYANYADHAAARSTKMFREHWSNSSCFSSKQEQLVLKQGPLSVANSSSNLMKGKREQEERNEKPLRERVSAGPIVVLPKQEQFPTAKQEQSLMLRKQDVVVDVNVDTNRKEKEDGEERKESSMITKGNENVVEVQEYVWADKYRPKALQDFICNKHKATHLQEIVSREGSDGCGHFIFEGPPGVGKRTMIWAMLREAFGPDIIEAIESYKAFQLKGEIVPNLQVHIKQSPQYVELNVADLKGYENHVIIQLFKETQTNIASESSCDLDNIRAIILLEADKLSTDALLYMRWLLERYKGFSKVFFCCSDVSKLQPIKDLCTIIQLAPPSSKEIVEVLEFIAKQEGIELPHELASMMTENSKNNLRQAIRSFEATYRKKYPFKDHIILTGWEDHIANIAKNIIEEQSPKQLYIIRGKLQTLITHEVPSYFVFKTLVDELKSNVPEPLCPQIDILYRNYNRNEENGIKKVDHYMRIEEFIAKFMSIFKQSKAVTCSIC